MTHLTKSRYLCGLQCVRRLWRVVHDPLPYEDPEPGSVQAVGHEVGIKAHLLFPGGQLVDFKPWEHLQAQERTRELMADRSVPAIFEATFEHEGIRVRVDVLERLSKGWALHEVKSSTGVKDYHLDDVALQVHVVRGTGIRLASVNVITVNTDYVRGKRGISWRNFFARHDVYEEVEECQEGIEDRLEGQWATLRKRKEPQIEPGPHCKTPYGCEFWDHCTADKPKDWVNYLPGLRAARLKKFAAAGIEAISAIPDDFPLTNTHARIRDAVRSGKPFIATDLPRLLRHAGPPSLYLDFEAFNPAIPLYAGTRPYQMLPFQWSLHGLDADGTLTHQEFLAKGNKDPRRAFAESLIRAVGPDTTPILVYSHFEQTQLKALKSEFEDLSDSIEAIIERLVDLLPVVRGAVYHPDFGCSFSIKNVGPALCPGLTYDDLDLVAEGGAASAAFSELASGECDPERTKALREALLIYCERDTMAMVKVHRALLEMAG